MEDHLQQQQKKTSCANLCDTITRGCPSAQHPTAAAAVAACNRIVNATKCVACTNRKKTPSCGGSQFKKFQFARKQFNKSIFYFIFSHSILVCVYYV